MEIESIISNNLVMFVFYNVEGHTDNNKDFVYEKVSQSTKRNINMNNQAKTLMKYLK